MTLPAALLTSAAQHPCFSGVFDRGHRIEMHIGSSAAPSFVVDFQCEDCLLFRLGCLSSDLPQGMSIEQAAAAITDHVRTFRGYALSIGGYHTTLNGWLSAVYWDGAGLFAIHADRGQGTRKPALEVLIDAFQQKLIVPAHPAMLDPKQYATQDVFLSVVPPPTVTSVASLLASCHVSSKWKSDYCRVTLAEFLPVSQAQAVTAAMTPAPSASCASPPSSAPPSKVVGQHCDVCGEIVGERWLLTSRYIGCRCGLLRNFALSPHRVLIRSPQHGCQRPHTSAFSIDS